MRQEVTILNRVIKKPCCNWVSSPEDRGPDLRLAAGTVFQAEGTASAEAPKQDLAHSAQERLRCQFSCSRKSGTPVVTE